MRCPRLTALTQLRVAYHVNLSNRQVDFAHEYLTIIIKMILIIVEERIIFIMFFSSSKIINKTYTQKCQHNIPSTLN